MGFFLECCIIRMKESAGAIDAEFESYVFSHSVFFSWQRKEGRPRRLLSGSEVMQSLAEGTLLAEIKKLPQPSKSYAIDPPHPVKMGPRQRDGFRFAFSYQPRQVPFLFHVVLPDFCLSERRSILPTDYMQRYHETMETLTWPLTGDVNFSIRFLAPNKVAYERERTKKERVGLIPDEAKESYREMKDWTMALSSLAPH